VDAAIATAAALGLTTPAMTGLGGDMFMLFYDAETKTVRSINGSGRCAAALTPERVRADLEATGGGAGVAEGTWGNGARTCVFFDAPFVHLKTSRSTKTGSGQT
jgi:hypothetical protein